MVSQSSNNYPYKAYLETLLSYGTEAKATHLRSALWYDDNDEVDASDPTVKECKNAGLVKRGELCAQSSTMQLIFRPHLDLIAQERYMLPGVDVDFKFIKNSPKFSLMSAADDANFKIQITDATMYVKRVKPDPLISLEHARMLDSGKSAKYMLRRGVVSSFTIPKDNLSYNKESIISGRLPRRCILGFVTNQSFNGDFKSNPYNFQHFDLRSLTLHNGEQQYPAQPFNLAFNDNIYLGAYDSLIRAMGLDHCDNGIGIDRERYLKGKVLLGFDMSKNEDCSSHIDLTNYGTLRFESHFGTPLAQPINVIIYAEYDNVVQVNSSRTVITDFAS